MSKANKSGKASKDEVLPGVSRRQFTIYAGAASGIYVVLMILLLFIGIGRRTSFTNSDQATRSAIAAAETQVVELTRAAATEQQGATETLQAIFEATGIVGGSARGGTLPPTWTPTNTEEIINIITPTATALPPPPTDLFAGNVIVGWGGPDRLNNGFRQLLSFSLETQGLVRPIGDVLVTSSDINPAEGETVLYTRYYSETFDFGLERSNLNGSQAQRVADAWSGITFMTDQQQAQFSHDGSQVVFIAQSPDTFTNEIYLLSLNFIPGANPLRQLTNDASQYSYPSISPDGSRVAAVKVDPTEVNAGEDIVIIDIQTGDQTQVTDDGPAIVESDVRWIPNTEEIVFKIAVGDEEAPGDIFRLAVGPDAETPPFPIVRDPVYDESNPVISPDGRWMAYASNRTGEYNIFIHDLQSAQDYQLTNEANNPVFPGGWYQPDVVPVRPVIVPLPTPSLDG